MREQLRLGPPEQQKKHVNDTSCSQSRKRQKGDRLLEGEWISNRSGRDNRNIYASVRPYRQMDDPKSDAFVDRMSREKASELDKENHLEI